MKRHKKKRWLEDGGATPKEDGDLLREHQTTHKKAVGCGRVWKVKKKKGTQGTRKPKKRKVNEGERERTEIDSKRSCLNRLYGKVVEVLCLVSEVESARWIPWIFRCVCLLCLRLCLL